MELRLLDRFEEILISALMAVAVLLIFVAVLHRYSIGITADVLIYARSHDMPQLQAAARKVYGTINALRLTWVQEACIYLFIWMAKFGAAYGVRSGIHVGVDLLVEQLPPKWQRRTTILAFLGCILFTALIIWIGATFVWRTAQGGQISADMELPMWIVYLAVPAGSALMCLRFLQALCRYLTTGKIARHDHGHLEGVGADDGGNDAGDDGTEEGGRRA